MNDAGQVAADWYPDPMGRFEHRYWDGSVWTESVSTAGSQSLDPLQPSAPRTEDATPVTVATGGATVSVPAFWPAPRIIAAVGSALLALGSLLPWAEVSIGIFSRSVAGTDGDGVLTLILGLVSGAIFVAAGRNSVLIWLGIVLAFIGLGIAGYDLINIARTASNVPAFADASAGIGIILCVVGGLVASLSGVAYWAAVNRTT